MTGTDTAPGPGRSPAESTMELKLGGAQVMPTMVAARGRPPTEREPAGDPISTIGMSPRQMDDLAQQASDAIAKLYYSHAEIPDLRGQHLSK